MTESDSKEGKEMHHKRKRTEDACQALSRYNSDDRYQFLNDRTAELLAADMKHLESGEMKQIGLAAKWCPSLDSSFDPATLLCESSFSSRVCNPLCQTLCLPCTVPSSKEVLAPLRKELDLPEVHVTRVDGNPLITPVSSPWP